MHNAVKFVPLLYLLPCLYARKRDRRKGGRSNLMYLYAKLLRPPYTTTPLPFLCVTRFSGHNPSKHKLDLGSWIFEVGSWRLDLGSWILEGGHWKLYIGSWILTAGYWKLDLGGWILEAGTWKLDLGSWILEVFVVLLLGGCMSTGVIPCTCPMQAHAG